jgi:hypothetical protein
MIRELGVFGSTDLAERRFSRHGGPVESLPRILNSKKKVARMATSAVAAPVAFAAAQNLKVYTADEMSQQDIKACIARPRVDFQSILQTVCHLQSPLRIRFFTQRSMEWVA